MARSKRRKIVERVTPVGMDVPEGGIPEFDVTITPMGELMTRVTVRNLRSGQSALSSCKPGSEEAMIENLKVRLYDWGVSTTNE